MLRIIFLGLALGLSFSAVSGEINEGLKQTHEGVGRAASQLSDAIDNLSHVLGTEKRSVATDSEVTAKTILNGLKQLAADPALDPKDSYEFLKNQEARASDPQKKKEIQNRIQEQINLVMKKMGFKPLAGGSSTFQRDSQRIHIRFSQGEILVEPIQSLPPVDPQ